MSAIVDIPITCSGSKLDRPRVETLHWWQRWDQLTKLPLSNNISENMAASDGSLDMDMLLRDILKLQNENEELRMQLQVTNLQKQIDELQNAQ